MGLESSASASTTGKLSRTRYRTIVEVTESAITEAVRLLFGLANLKVEPTGALSIAAGNERVLNCFGGIQCAASSVEETLILRFTRDCLQDKT